VGISKKQKKHLRELAGIGYERDLERCLNVVKDSFEKWEAGDISVWDLNDRIHEFHDDIARELYKAYSSIGDPIYSVAFGVRQGVIDIKEIDKECMPLLEPLLEYFNDAKNSQA
jgi:hypothetical protein